MTIKTATSVNTAERLKAKPQQFDFFQAVRLLEVISRTDKSRREKFASQPVAELAPPHKEFVHFHASPGLAFSATDIVRLKVQEQEQTPDPENRHQWRMEVSFMGLVGSQGVLPQHYSETVLKELKARNRGLRDFLDLFHHRTLSLFYRAWVKYQLPVQFERQRRGSNQAGSDVYSQAIKSLAGLGLPGLQNRTSLSDDIAGGMAGLLGRSVPSAMALKSAIRHHFGLQAEIEQFIGDWNAIPPDLQTRMPGPSNRYKGVNNVLGRNVVLGQESWQVQSRFRIVLEPMPYRQYMDFLPGSRRLEALRSLVNMFAGHELDFDIHIQVKQQELQPLQLTQTEDYYPMLGLNSRLKSDQVNDQMITITAAG
ncbi:type VI secretion system baseplate subunit TssG [Endozoicomonas lisbonensis]|uniref:Type VI secretion system protein ImpH n=1 Tax=Endozoicomonas lisbonensis TaxID=3120522 RepID=A0ABV2SAP0_9GAMM